MGQKFEALALPPLLIHLLFLFSFSFTSLFRFPSHSLYFFGRQTPPDLNVVTLETTKSMLAFLGAGSFVILLLA